MTQDASSDDDAPEIVPYSISKADVKRNQKAVRDFEVEEKARRKAHNRERDQKLKERARATRGGKPGEKQKSVRFSVESDSGADDGDDDDDMEARMLRAMRDAADEVLSAERDRDDDDENKGFGEGVDLGSGWDFSFAQDEDGEDSEMSLRDGDLADMEDPTDDEEMDENKEDDETLPPKNIRRSSSRAGYLDEELFAAAFASQNAKPEPQKNKKSTQSQILKKRRRKFNAHLKDLVIGGRTIRTLPQLSDPQSQATARSVPSARACKFVDHSLAMRGKQALLKAKEKGWERRSANVGVMKYQGAPHGFARSIR